MNAERLATAVTHLRPTERSDPPDSHALSAKVDGSASSLQDVDRVVDLAAIFEPSTSVVTLRRTPPSGLVHDAVGLARASGARRFVIDPDTAAQTLDEELAGFPDLASDVGLWVQVLVDLTGCESVGVRIALMPRPMCPRLHVDRVTLRLVVTYQGSGTEYVSNGHIDRRQLGHPASGTADEESGLLPSPDCVRRAGTYDVVLLKGEAWPDNVGRGAVHRSPPMSADSERLVMTLDPL